MTAREIVDAVIDYCEGQDASLDKNIFIRRGMLLLPNLLVKGLNQELYPSDNGTSARIMTYRGYTVNQNIFSCNLVSAPKEPEENNMDADA